MTTKSLNPLDASWLLVESRETPMHVGGLAIFQLPDDAPEDFFLDLMAEFRGTNSFAAPWNQKLRQMSIKGLMPTWESTDEVDLEHHVRHAALPQPGGERELGQLIARLHSQPLDLTRPPWEFSLIEGLEHRRFAFYTKMHHSLIDGISGMKMLVRSMSTDRVESRRLPAFWSIGASSKAKGKLKRKLSKSTPAAAPTTAHAVAEAWGLIREQVTSVPGVVRAFGSMLGGIAGKKDKMMVPFDTPSSIFNGRIKGQRRFATQIYAIERLRNLAHAAGATLNDVVLAICGGALRRFLLELDALPEKPLTTGIPVSVRPKDDEGTGNAITFIIATLATDVDDPLERLHAITASTRLAKNHVQSLPRQAMTQYTMVLMAPYIMGLVTGVGGRMRPMFNITISNVPGPEDEMYFRGAKMEATYPVSLVSHGQALNITCQSYGGKLAFGFTGCRDTLPHMQRIATYTGEALAELEAALVAASAKPVKAPRRKLVRSTSSSTKPRAAAKAKPPAKTSTARSSTKAGTKSALKAKPSAAKRSSSAAAKSTRSTSAAPVKTESTGAGSKIAELTSARANPAAKPTAKPRPATTAAKSTGPAKARSAVSARSSAKAASAKPKAAVKPKAAAKPKTATKPRAAAKPKTAAKPKAAVAAKTGASKTKAAPRQRKVATLKPVSR